MNYNKSRKYNDPALQAKMMGPNPIKLEEELLMNQDIPKGSIIEIERWYCFLTTTFTFLL